ncbi:MAG: glucose-6-phosphate isomerase, partial [Gammaproteobacteria bacterium]|nr:glucose-6-phosphate isomerase [Gammaproteobacteria bacterium]
ITDVVNLGIGGSDLGPRMACNALRDEASPLVRLHFVSNVDGGDITHALRNLDPARTAFIVASKSFTTTETMRNARTAQAWLAEACPDPARRAPHFLGITARPDRAREFGIDESRILPLWDWVGGRFSLWSAIGLPVAMAVGMEKFEELLAGAADMDRHFREAPWGDNLPVLLALVGIWNSNFLGAETFAVVPYEQRLAHLPGYLQQLEMESNGKRITHDNEVVTGHTAPILWGGLGTDVQHAFFQLLHQGTRLVPVDFILALHNPLSPSGHHDMLVANCLAQAQALMQGRTAASLKHAAADDEGINLPLHRAMPGNQPSNLLLMDELTPRSLGALVALYEHKTFVQGVIWGVNSFDQWGVELGKVLADALLEDIHTNTVAAQHDPSTAAALRRYLNRRTNPNRNE